MRLLNWNLQFAPAGRPRGRAIAAVIAQHEPDVVCLTETLASWPMAGGHWIWADADYGYPNTGDRRKVGLWSRAPWTEVDEVGHPDLPGGRFVAGVTETDLEPIRFVGVCVPWQMAHVSTGRRDRAPWDDHVAYLDGLRQLLGASDRTTPTVVVGDYNQRLPRRRVPVRVHDALLIAFAPLTVLTSGPVAGLEDSVIDHVAVSPGLVAEAVAGISRVVDGATVSDHDGVVVELALG